MRVLLVIILAMQIAPLLPKIYNCEKKVIVCQGGGDSAKTVSILQKLAVKLTQHEKSDKALATVTGRDLPNLKGGALNTFEKYVMPDMMRWIKKFNSSSNTYTLYNNARLEFKAFENEEDARGSEREYLYVNEGQGVPYSMFWQLNRKTRIQSIIDYNPTSRFWVHDKLLGSVPGEKQFENKVQLYITDHRHNPFLSEEDHNNYELISDPDLFNVYARGKTGKVKGLVFGHFKCAPFPLILDRIFWGLDLGYTNDPTVLVKIGAIGKKRYGQECCYQPGISAQGIKDLLFIAGWESGQLIYCEADPNMINQLRLLGMPVYPAIKGPGSIAAGISKVREYECFYTPDSINAKKELETYKFIEAQDLVTGKTVLTNQAMDAWNHWCDAFRYGVYSDAYKNIRA
jgi:phage terminase large subunit